MLLIYDAAAARGGGGVRRADEEDGDDDMTLDLCDAVGATRATGRYAYVCSKEQSGEPGRLPGLGAQRTYARDARRDVYQYSTYSRAPRLAVRRALRAAATVPTATTYPLRATAASRAAPGCTVVCMTARLRVWRRE